MPVFGGNKMTKVGINGFGRIGRQVLKSLIENYAEDLEVVNQ